MWATRDPPPPHRFLWVSNGSRGGMSAAILRSCHPAIYRDPRSNRSASQLLRASYHVFRFRDERRLISGRKTYMSTLVIERKGNLQSAAFRFWGWFKIGRVCFELEIFKLLYPTDPRTYGVFIFTPPAPTAPATADGNMHLFTRRLMDAGADGSAPGWSGCYRHTSCSPRSRPFQTRNHN